MDWHADVKSTKHTNRFGERSPQDATYYYDWEHIYQTFKKRLYSETYLVDRADDWESEPECDHFTGMVGQVFTDGDCISSMNEETAFNHCPKCGEKL